MKKNIYLALGALLVVVVGGWLFFSGKGSDSGSGSTGLLSALSADSGVKCTRITAMGDAGSSEGTMYFYKDKARYDSVINHKQMGKRDMHILITKDKTYAWGSAFAIPGMTNGGLVFSNEENSDFSPPEIADIEELKKNDFKVPGLNCEKWTPDPNLLNPPKDMQFSSQEEIMQNMMGGFGMPGVGASGAAPGMGAMAVPCSACEEIGDKTMKEKCEKQCIK